MADIMNTDYVSDNRFWLQIMGDLARFILNALSPVETSAVLEAQKFIRQFDGLLADCSQQMSSNKLRVLSQQAYKVVQDFRKYILYLAKRQLSGDLVFSLRPSFINHMVNDTEQYLNLLFYYLQNKTAVLNPASVSLVWLMNVYVSAMTIEDALDATSFNCSKIKARNLANETLDLYCKSYVMNGLIRTGLNDFPALTSLIDDIENVMKRYAEFLVDQIKLMEEKKVLGNLTILYLDSMYRQLCYYMKELSKVSSIKLPECNSNSPRKEK